MMMKLLVCTAIFTLAAAADDKACEKARSFVDKCDCDCEYPKDLTLSPQSNCSEVQSLVCPSLENCCDECYAYLEMYLSTCVFDDSCSCDDYNGECAPGDESCLNEQEEEYQEEEYDDGRYKSKYGIIDPIWLKIEEEQGDEPFGKILDSGTGRGSLTFLSQINATSIHAVTAAPDMKVETLKTANEVGVHDLNITLGNWFGDEPIEFGFQFDTILADYLIGAISGFSDFYQEEMLPRLVSHLKPGGKLFIIGWQPIPIVGLEAEENIISQMRRVRDASIILAGEAYYREYPIEWTERQLAKLDVDIVSSAKFPQYYDLPKVQSQLNNGRRVLSKVPSKKVGQAMRQLIDDIEEEARDTISRYGYIAQGFDYVVVAQKRG